MRRLIDITSEDIKRGNRGDENTCAIALALQEAYNTLNVSVQKEDITYRSGAQKNDLICTTGNLGAAFMGLQLLIREKEVFKTNPNSQPDLSHYQYLVQRQLKPETPIALKEKLEKIFEKDNVQKFEGKVILPV